MAPDAPTPSAEVAALQADIAKLTARLAAYEAREVVIRQMLDNLPATLYATYSDGRIAVVNSVFASQWGRSTAEFEGYTLTELFPPETAAAWQQNIDAALSDPRPTTSREIYGEGDQARHYDNQRFPIYGADGTPIALGGIASDITERVRAEQSYTETRRMLEGIVNNSPAVIYVKDTQGRLLLVNQTYAAVLGQPVTALLGRTEDEIFPTEMVAGWRERDKNMFTSGESLHYDNTFVLNGETREFITVQFPLYDDEHNPYAICGISTDVTDLKRGERDRQQLQEQVIEAQQVALRELNTPLIPLADDVVVMPLIGSIDSARATQVMETLLEGVSIYHARLAILDITGLPVVDSQVANALLQAAQAVKLLGAEVLLTGIGPEVAQTLIGIGADLSGLRTPGTLQSGIDYALRSRKGSRTAV